jgi:aminopeptidase N
MSQRISVYEDQVKLTALMEKLGENVSASTKTEAMKRIDDNKVFLISTKYDEITTFVDAQAKKMQDIENQLRLPSSSAPERYRLHLDTRNVQLGLLGFSGEVEIDIKIKERTDYIMFHSKNQDINSLMVHKRGESAEIPILDYHQYDPAGTLTIYFMESMPTDTEITVHIKYTSALLTGSSAFYQTSYVQDGIRKYLATTQFQPTGARFCFPHYDEPGLKAVFELKITHDPSFSAIANTFGEDFEK